MRNPVVYLLPHSRGGGETSLAEVATISGDEYMIHRFDDGKLFAELRSTSIIKDARTVPPQHWLRYNLIVQNIKTTDPEGFPLDEPLRVPDPDASKGYRTFEEAEKAYKALLSKYTKSRYDPNTGIFKEVGNIYAPPDPDVPMQTEETGESFGSW